jgi:5'-3' exonuclease
VSNKSSIDKIDNLILWYILSYFVHSSLNSIQDLTIRIVYLLYTNMGGQNIFKRHQDCGTPRHSCELKGTKQAIDMANQLYRHMIGNRKRKRGTLKEVHEYIDITKMLQTIGLHKHELNNDSSSAETDIKSDQNVDVESGDDGFDSNSDDELDDDNSSAVNEFVDFEDSISHIIAVCLVVFLTIDRNIFPVLVFDGKAPELKKAKLLERKQNREKAEEERDRLDDKNSDEYIKQNKRCVSLQGRHYNESIELMKAFGLPTVVSYGEADPQCAAFACDPSVCHGVIGNDSDLLLFGANRVVKDFSRKNAMYMEFKLTDILTSMKKKINKIREEEGLPQIDKFTNENFIDLSILCGTDYNKAITGFENTDSCMIELFAKFDLDVEKVVAYLKTEAERNNHINIPGNFIELWQKVREYYINAKVIDPQSINTDIHMPNISQMTKLLVDKYCFKKEVVDKLYNGLISLYNMYHKITGGSESYKSFRSYQVKFHGEKKYQHRDHRDHRDRDREQPQIPSKNDDSYGSSDWKTRMIKSNRYNKLKHNTRNISNLPLRETIPKIFSSVPA